MDRKLTTVLSIVIGILGAGLIVTALFLMFQNKGFTKYNDDSGQFSLLYPSNWLITPGGGGSSVLIQSPQENDLDFYLENVNIVIQDLSGKQLSLMDYSDIAVRQIKAVFKNNVNVLEANETRFAGRAGYKFSYIGHGPQGDLKIVHYWTIKGPKAYQFTYAALATKFDNYLPQIEKMVKSFTIKN